MNQTSIASPTPGGRTYNTPRDGTSIPPPYFARSRPTPLSPDRLAVLRTRIDELPRHPNTAEGRDAYRKQIDAWVAANGATGVVSETAPVPLKPGTENTGMGECFTCGLTGHNVRDGCPALAANSTVPRKEQEWRRFVFTHLRAFRRDAARTYYYSDFQEDRNDPFAIAAAALASSSQGKQSSM